MTSTTFEIKVKNMTRNDLEFLVHEMEAHLLGVIDDEAQVDDHGVILPPNQQYDYVGNIMRLIEF